MAEILTVDCLIKVPYDFTIEDFHDRLNYVLYVDKVFNENNLEIAETHCIYLDKVPEDERADYVGYRDYLVNVKQFYDSFKVYNSEYIFNGGNLKIRLGFEYDKAFKEVEENLHRCIDKVYQVYSLEEKYKMFKK